MVQLGRGARILRHALAVVHAGLAVLCAIAFAISNTHSDEPMAALGGFALFSGMAVAIWFRSRWILLPGCLLAVAFAALAFMFSMAVLWPASSVEKFAVASLLMLAFEVASMVSILTQRSALRS